MLRPRLSRPRPVRAATQRTAVKTQMLTPMLVAPNCVSIINNYSRNKSLTKKQELFSICYEPFSVWNKLLKADVTCPTLSTLQTRKRKSLSKLSKSNGLLLQCMPLAKTKQTTTVLLTRRLTSNSETWPLELRREYMPRSHHRLVGPWCHRTHFHEYTSSSVTADAPLHSPVSSISMSRLSSAKSVSVKEKNGKTHKWKKAFTKEQWSQLSLWKRTCRLCCKFYHSTYFNMPKPELRKEELESENDKSNENLQSVRTNNKIVNNLKADGELTEEKKTVLKMAMQGASMFIGGKAGTGKSHLLREIVREMSACGLRVAVTASTGVAALNINGNTFHSTFGVPIEFDSCTECKYTKNNNVSCEEANTEREHKTNKRSKKTSSRAKMCNNEELEEFQETDLSKKEMLTRNNQKRCSSTSSRSQDRVWFASSFLSSIDVIMIDEISMLHAGYFEALEVAARCARPHSKHIPFGGIQVIVSGDFMQLRPFADKVGQSQMTTRTTATSSINRRSHTFNENQGQTKLKSKQALKGEKQHQQEQLEEEEACASSHQRPKINDDIINQEIEDRIVCKGVERNRDVIRKVASEKFTLCQGSNNTSSTDKKKRSKEEKMCKNDKTTIKEHRNVCCTNIESVREPIAYYCDRPMYDSYAFRHYLIHLQLHVAARQVDDLDFLDDLNALRRGVLSHRLLYSALLNKPDATAIRLYATKRAVRDFNTLQMLQLKGKEHVFITKLHLGFSSPISTDGKYNNKRKQHSNNDCITTNCGDSTSNNTNSNKELESSTSSNSSSCKTQSDAVLLEFYKAAADDGENNNNNFKRKTGTSKATKYHSSTSNKSQRFRSWKALVQNIAHSAGIDNHELLMHEIAGNVYMRSKMCRVIVHCTASSAQHALARLRLLEASAARLIKTHSRSSSSRVESGWNLMRYREINRHQLAALARPAIERRIRRHMMLDFVLQNKNLKVGCRVMLLRNLNTKYVNGSLGTVVSFRSIHKCRHLIPTDLKINLHPLCFHARNSNCSATMDSYHGEENDEVKEDDMWQNDKLILPIVRMDHDHTLVAIPWIELELPATVEETMVSGKVWSMPLIPAYAFTVHKIQGITFDHPVLFDAEGMFVSDHIVYVAASRVKRFDQLRICNLSPRMITVHKPSMVFSDSLSDVYSAEEQWNAWRRSASAN